MNRVFCFLCIFIFISNLEGQNLVPNGSFEELRNLPVKANPKRTFTYEPMSGYIPYQKNLKYWFAATATSPDLRIHNQEKYNTCRRKFKFCDKAHSGQNCVGIITYMGNGKTDTYREYIQVRLKKNLRPKVITHVEFWIAKEREAKLVSNNVGFHFSMKKTSVKTMETLNLIPQINCDSLINTEKKQWIKIEYSFVPEAPFKYLLIGNFYDNDHTKMAEFPNYRSSSYIPPYAYYLIDDIRIWQDGDEKESQAIIFEEKEIVKNEPIQLENIEFEFDSSVLASSSYETLNKLLEFLKNHPSINIAIHGHTDHQGSDAYNLSLSKDRATSVLNYLISRGIEKNRLTSQGFGERNPLVENDSKLGKSKNRRVEFLILE